MSFKMVAFRVDYPIFPSIVFDAYHVWLLKIRPSSFPLLFISVQFLIFSLSLSSLSLEIRVFYLFLHIWHFGDLCLHYFFNRNIFSFISMAPNWVPPFAVATTKFTSSNEFWLRYVSLLQTENTNFSTKQFLG